MTTHKMEIKTPPHLQTEEGAKRFARAIEARRQADYECFMVLRELSDNELLTEKKLRKLLQAEVGMGITASEADECAEHWAERVKEALQERLKADAEVSNAITGRT